MSLYWMSMAVQVILLRQAESREIPTFPFQPEYITSVVKEIEFLACLTST